MRSRVVSASALKTRSISVNGLVIYMRLDKYSIPRLPSLHTFTRMYQERAMTDTDVQAAVQQKYGTLAKAAGQTAVCCVPAPCGCGDPITSNLYSEAETQGLPAGAVAVSLGCGNPTALVQLEAGQTVLDLGSGGGID